MTSLTSQPTDQKVYLNHPTVHHNNLSCSTTYLFLFPNKLHSALLGGKNVPQVSLMINSASLETFWTNKPSVKHSAEKLSGRNRRILYDEKQTL